MEFQMCPINSSIHKSVINSYLITRPQIKLLVADFLIKNDYKRQSHKQAFDSGVI